MRQPDTESRLPRLLFLIFAPITVPAYLLLLAYVNLAGIAFYLVVEMTIARLTRRPIHLSRSVFWLISPVVIVLAGLALVAHLLIWAVRVTLAGLVAAGRWQTGLRGRAASLTAGAAWFGAFAWCLVMSIDGTLAMALVGREVAGSGAFSQAVRRRTVLRDLPPPMQERRRHLIESLRSGVNADLPQADYHAEILSDDTIEFAYLHQLFQYRIAGMPWYFVPAELSPDGSAHCNFLPGLLLLTLLLLVRWPGLHRRLPAPGMTTLAFFVRLGATLAALAYVLTWSRTELIAESAHWDAVWFRAASPLAWLGVDPGTVAPPEWLTLNAALWVLLLGLAVMLWRIAARLAGTLGVPRYYSAYLAARLLQRKRIAFFSIGAVTLCVAMLLIVISVMDGFVETIRSRARGLLGDLVMDGDLRGFPYYAEFIAELRGWPEVVQATALVHSYGTLRFERGETFPVQVWGVTLDEYCGVNDFCKNLFYAEHYPGTTQLGPQQMPVYGFDPANDRPVLPEPFESALAAWLATQPIEVRKRYERTPAGYFPGPGVFRLAESEGLQPGMSGKAYPGIIVGRDIIARRTPSGEYRRTEAYPRGCACVVTMLPITRTGLVSAEPPPAPAFRYVDDSRTGIYEIDSKNVYVDFAVLQDKLQMGAMPRADGTGEAPPRCSQIQIKLAPGSDLGAMKQRVAEAWFDFARRIDAAPDDYRMMDHVHVSTWEEMQAEFIAAIRKEKVLVVVMFSIISLVAVFLVLCIFYMIVIEKTRDIGIIKSVGGSAEGVAAVFLTYGATIGIVGSALGSLIGWAFVRRINDVQDWLARLNPEWRIWSPETYSFDKIPDVVNPSDVVFIAIAAVLASVLGAVIPALRAARTWPVEALRYE